MKQFSLCTATVTILASHGAAQNSASNNNWVGVSPSQRYIVNATQAQTIIQAAAAEAANLSISENIAVLDPFGLLVGFLRMDSAYPGSIDISIKKARTVGLWNGKFNSVGLYNSSQPGGPLYGIEETNGGLVVFNGGVALILDEVFIGAVGVSGGSTAQDVQCANAGARAVGEYIQQ